MDGATLSPTPPIPLAFAGVVLIVLGSLLIADYQGIATRLTRSRETSDGEPTNPEARRRQFDSSPLGTRVHGVFVVMLGLALLFALAAGYGGSFLRKAGTALFLATLLMYLPVYAVRERIGRLLTRKDKS